MSGRYVPLGRGLEELTAEQQTLVSDAIATAFEAGRQDVAHRIGLDQSPAHRSVWEALLALRGDELEVLAEVARGLMQGRAVYGQLELDTDRRDWLAETLAEVRDGLVYVGAKLVRARRLLGEGAKSCARCGCLLEQGHRAYLELGAGEVCAQCFEASSERTP